MRIAPGLGERTAALSVLAAALALRLACILHYRIDSDEPQHLHVVWAWTQGLLPYRDVFDNHMPLFHFLCAPLLLVIGERPSVLLWMRVAMLPLYFLSIWAVGRLAETLFTPRDGLWAMALSGLSAGFFFCSLEFRPDDLWMVCWFLALLVAVGGPVTPWRSALVGLCLGAATAVSLKTALMLLAFVLAALGTVAIVADDQRPESRPRIGTNLLAGLAGFVPLPLAIVLGFAHAGALGPFLYGTVWHNALPGLGRRKLPFEQLLSLPALVGLWFAARWVFRSTDDRVVGSRRVFVLIATGAYAVAFFTLWPLRSQQDYLPLSPLLMLWAVPALRAAGDLLAARWSRLPRASVPAAAGIVLTALLVVRGQPWIDNTRDATGFIADVLRLTDETEPVLDMKGDAVYRRRPYYYALESVTKARLRRGLLVDDIPERLIATRTLVTLGAVNGFPPRAREFLRRNYIRVGRIRVAGQVLERKAAGAPVSFSVVIPADYELLAENEMADGTLDGLPNTGPRRLGTGPHVFVPTDSATRLALVWARAVAEGFLPFASPAGQRGDGLQQRAEADGAHCDGGLRGVADPLGMDSARSGEGRGATTDHDAPG